jgi:adenylate cyclase
MHPALSMLIYGFVISAFALAVMLSVRTYMGPMMDEGAMDHMHGGGPMGAKLGMGPGSPMQVMSRMVAVFPALFAFSIVTIMMLRIAGYLGGRNLLNLMTAKYYRPVLEKRVFLFLDMIGSTALAERLGALRTRALIGKFFFDISAPVSDTGGEIYRFVGDGIIAVWAWETAVTNNRIIRAIDLIRASVEAGREHYEREFGYVPQSRIGVHGDEIVTSEEGDTRRAIGFYGDAINIAARIEALARDFEGQCLLSTAVVEALERPDARLKALGTKRLHGISEPVALYVLQVRDETKVRSWCF